MAKNQPSKQTNQALGTVVSHQEAPEGWEVPSGGSWVVSGVQGTHTLPSWDSVRNTLTQIISFIVTKPPGKVELVYAHFTAEETETPH